MNKDSDVRKVIIFGEHFWNFYNKQTPKIKERINRTIIKLVKTVERVPKKYLKNITGTTLYELRIISGSNILLLPQRKVNNGVEWISKENPKNT